MSAYLKRFVWNWPYLGGSPSPWDFRYLKLKVKWTLSRTLRGSWAHKPFCIPHFFSFFLVAASGGHSLVVMHGLLTATASLAAEHGLSLVRASLVVAHGLGFLTARGIFPDLGLNHVACTGRRISNHWGTTEALSSIYWLQFPEFPGQVQAVANQGREETSEEQSEREV